MRTIAEIMRHLSQQREVNEWTRDLVATLVYCLRGIDATVEETINAWEKRGYWKKAADFQQKWWWSPLMANAIEALLRNGDWDNLPETMLKLYPRVSDIKINKMTRDPADWKGACSRLIGDNDAGAKAPNM
jgi:hypothetical protein